MYVPVGTAPPEAPPRGRDGALCFFIAVFAILVFMFVIMLGARPSDEFVAAARPVAGNDSAPGHELIDRHEYESPAKVNASSMPARPPARCVPKTCLRSKNFTFDHALYGIVDYTMLASFPGSGNTFIRSVVEEGTRIFSGSMYDDKTLSSKYEFTGELLPSFREPIMSVIKTHFPLYTALNPKLTGAVYILRSPWDAMVSEFNREHGEWSKTKTNATHATVWEFETEFTSWADRMQKEWLRSVHFWTNASAFEGLSEYQVASPLLNRTVDRHSKHFIPVLVLLYEVWGSFSFSCAHPRPRARAPAGLCSRV